MPWLSKQTTAGIVIAVAVCGGLLVAINRATYTIPISKPTPTATPSATPSTHISTIIVPHHQIVAAKRDAFFAQVAPQLKPKTVILISPNHYDSGKGTVQTDDQTWSTSVGDIAPDTDLIKQLLNDQPVSNEPGSFYNEHGIHNILQDVRQSFPEARIVPIIFKSNTTEADASALGTYLAAHCSDCLLVTSVDFSHYQPSLLAELHDELSRRAMENLDQKTLFTNAEVDSPAALVTTAAWASAKQTPHLHVEAQTDSGVLTGQPDIQTTTHMFAWYESGAQAKPADGVSFTIGGDIMLGRSVAATYLPKTDGLKTVAEGLGDRAFWGTDAKIVNLEGPISPTPVPINTEPNNLTFNFPPQSIDVLKYLHVNVASQANNHSANAGSAGLAATRQMLSAAAINPLGGPGDDGIDKVVTISGQNMNLHIIGVHLLASQPDLTALITQYKQGPNDRVMIFPHWGIEYQTTHNSAQAALAHSWIDAGADLVIGAHPHVVQDSEIYKGVPIFYSMGNLVFDQWFSDETEHGLMLSGEFTTSGLRIFGIPVHLTKAAPSFVSDSSTKNKLLQRIYAPLSTYEQQSPAGTSLFFPNKQ